MLQHIDEYSTIDEFINDLSGLQIDQIVVVVNHGKDFMTFGYDCTDEFLDIALGLLKRYRAGDYSHIQEQ